MVIEASKTIRVLATGKPSHYYVAKDHITKEDHGRYLVIEGLDLPETYEVDFSNSRSEGKSITMIGNSDGVRIPKQLVDTGMNIYAFYYHVEEDFGQTTDIFKIINDYRPDRTDEEPTPEEQSVIDQTISALNEAVEQTQDAQEAIENMSVSAQTLAEGSSATVTKSEQDGVVHLEFGIPKGQTGDTPTITASKTGKTTSIYVDGSEIAQIEDGTDGTDGDDGYSPTANVSKTGKTATITITDQNGTTSAQVEDGTDGTDGVSPTVTITPITGGHRITITDADGEHSADVMDGTGNVDDVQIGNYSLVVDGVAKINIGNGLRTANNDTRAIVIQESNQGRIRTRSTATVLTPDQQHFAVYYGLAYAAGDTTQQNVTTLGAYTEDAKSKISEMLNGSVSVSGTTPTINAKAGIRYVCGEVATLDFTPSATGICDVVFTSGATATVLTVPSTIKWANGFDPTSLDANTTYEINILDGIYGAVMAWT